MLVSFVAAAGSRCQGNFHDSTFGSLKALVNQGKALYSRAHEIRDESGGPESKVQSKVLSHIHDTLMMHLLAITIVNGVPDTAILDEIISSSELDSLLFHRGTKNAYFIDAVANNAPQKVEGETADQIELSFREATTKIDELEEVYDYVISSSPHGHGISNRQMRSQINLAIKKKNAMQRLALSVCEKSEQYYKIVKQISFLYVY